MLQLTMCLVTNSRVRDIKIVGAIIDSYCIVTIVRHEIRDTDVRGADIERISVEWEALPFVGNGIHDRIRDVDITATNLYVPRNGLSRFQPNDASTLDIEHHQMWASSDTCSIRRVGIPPLLSIGVDPAVVWVLTACVTHV